MLAHPLNTGTGRHARLGWISRLAIRPRQRACDTASGSGECARSRTPIVSGWRSSAAPAFRALFGGWRACWLARMRRGNLGCSLLALRPRTRKTQPRGVNSWSKEARLSSVGGIVSCERCLFSRERIGRRRASEAGARASTSREPIASTRLVGAGRAGPIRSASDAVGEQPGLESGGLHWRP